MAAVRATPSNTTRIARAKYVVLLMSRDDPNYLEVKRIVSEPNQTFVCSVNVTGSARCVFHGLCGRTQVVKTTSLHSSFESP